MRKVAASIMCGDQLHLADEIKKLEEASVDILHCDVMDGIYVNNLALGPEYIETLKKATNIPLDIHLATVTPMKYIDMFAKLNPEYISFHIEVTDNVLEVIKKIRSYQVKPVLALNPETPVEDIYPYLDQIDMVLMMTVSPGFAGQAFRTDVIEKIRTLKDKISEMKLNVLIEVDGNIKSETIGLMKDCLPDVYVLGTSALFHKKDTVPYSLRIENIWSGIIEKKEGVN